MREKFFRFKDIADRMEEKWKKNGTIDDGDFMLLFTAVSNMGQIVITLMGTEKEDRGRIPPRAVVEEQAQKCDFIDMSIWNEFFMLRNQVAHRRPAFIMEIVISLLQKVVPEFEKEFELLIGMDKQNCS